VSKRVEVVLGIIGGVLILVMVFIVMVQGAQNLKLKEVVVRQGELSKELYIAKDQYRQEIENNNKEIAKELLKVQEDSTCFVGIGQRLAVSELLVRFIQQLGYDVIGREFKIIMKGDQGSYGKERDKTERSQSKTKES